MPARGRASWCPFHPRNCRARLSKDDDSKLRIIKKAPNRKINLAVAASTAVKRVLELNI